MLNYNQLNYSPLNYFGDLETGGGGVPATPPVGSIKTYNLTLLSSALDISAALSDMLDVIKQVAIDAGFTVADIAYTTTGDFVVTRALDITLNNANESSPRYAVLLPTGTTYLPVLTSYVGTSLELTQTLTYTGYEDLDRNNMFGGPIYNDDPPNLRVYANSTTGTLWYAISFGNYLYNFSCGLRIPRTDSQTLLQSYPKYGTFCNVNGVVQLGYGNYTYVVDGVDNSNPYQPCIAVINSIVSQSDLPLHEVNGIGIPNATRNYSYNLIPLITYSDTMIGDGWAYSIRSQPAVFSAINALRGVFLTDNVDNFSTFSYGGNTYAIIKNDYYRYFMPMPASAFSFGVESLSTGVTTLTNWTP